MGLKSILLIVFASTTTAVFLFFYFAACLLVSEKAAVRRRCREIDSEKVDPQTWRKTSQQEKRQTLSIPFSKFPPLLNLPLLFDQAGVNADPVRWLFLVTSLAAGGAFLCWAFTRSVLGSVCIGIFFCLVPYLYVLLKRRQRVRFFETHLPQALEIIARSLRAGHPFSMGLQMISTEMPPPIGTEFGRVFEENQLGLPLDDCLRALAERVPLLDLRFFVLSVLIHRQTGGDLAEVLDSLSGVVRERLKILGQVRALTAEGRMSGWVLSLLPVFVFFVIQAMNPEYLSILLETGTGRKLLYVALGLQLVGILLIRKIVSIRV
ncbi:MAG TPA: type II secretion system F family protein [bacterium]|nr:type II secretion system F family protein [bacterium]HQP98245.1 type II secretion system F family protein [bacterium]